MVELKVRLRRLRRKENLRQLVSETRLTPDCFIYPLFIVPGSGQRQEIKSMPGIYRLSIDLLPKEIEQIALLGIPAVLLFGIPENKDPQGSEAYHPQGIIQRAIRAVKDRVPEVLLITDVCLCEYTDHGHCGVIVKGRWITTAPLTFWLSPRWKPGLI